VNKVVFDASAILTAALNEPGTELVFRHAQNSVVSTVNLAEAQAKLVRRGVPPEDAWQAVLTFCHQVVPFDAEQARLSGEMVTATSPLGLSLGDRACLALATLLELPVYTSDQVWKKLQLGVEIRLLRQTRKPTP
jgi:PIN domain nuclease of toxin-antitoxin system